MLYNTIEQAVVRWSENSLPVLVKLFGVSVTVKRQVLVDAVLVGEPEPLAPEPTPEPTTVAEPTPEPEPYAPTVPSAPDGFMGSVYGGSFTLTAPTTQTPPPEPTPTPEPEPTTPQEALDDVYGSMAGPMKTGKEGSRYRIETFETILIPPRRDWVTAGTINIGGFEAVEVFAKGDLLEGDTIMFRRGDGSQYYYRVLRKLTLGVTESLLTKTYLIPVEAEEFHG